MPLSTTVANPRPIASGARMRSQTRPANMSDSTRCVTSSWQVLRRHFFDVIHHEYLRCPTMLFELETEFLDGVE